MNVVQLLDGKRICICAGPGGVGKTTTAAALAIGMAARGAKVAVVTIDPAKRLANALGLEQLENEPRLVPPTRLNGLVELRGELWAMVLDPTRTLDELIDRLAPSPERAEEIKHNRIYQELSSSVSGSQEFAAIEKLYELASDDYDLLVLDTPPSQNAVEFLNAPGRLTAFLSGETLLTLLRPTGIGMRLLGLGAAPLLAGLKLVTGVDLVTDVTAFFTLLGEMPREFKARAELVEELLHAPDTAFVLVTSAQTRPIDEAIRLRDTLVAYAMPLTGVVVNRVSPSLSVQVGVKDPDPALSADLTAKLAACVADHTVRGNRDAANIERLRSHFPGYPILQIPELDHDVHDLQGLLRVHAELFRSGTVEGSRLAGFG